VIRQVISDPRTAAFHLGRITGYALAGALAAALTGTLAWLSAHGQGLRPLWTVFHLGVLAWGLSLLVLARQPAGAHRASLWLWARISPWVRARQGLFLAGLLWLFMPCGLLWSALLVASLAGSPWAGALVMVIFATASSLGLLAVPGVLARLRVELATGQDWDTRLAGGLLVASALAALWMALGQRLIDYCT
jgi:sulfite exporter TauE/SafE